MGRKLRLGFAALIVVGCADREPVGPHISAVAQMYEEVVISDGAHGGNPHFYFLPPLLPPPGTTGVFEARHAPVVLICVRDQPVAECETGPVARFTNADGPGDERVEVASSASHFRVNWRPRDSGVDEGEVYRIRVLTRGEVMGHVDVRFGSARADNAASGEAIVLQKERTLPIRFRIEVGALCQGLDCLELEYIQGQDGEAYPGQPLSVGPRVRVQDIFGDPVAGAEVHFSADMDGEVSAAVSLTDGDGLTDVLEWTLGDQGVNTLTASVPGGPSASLVIETLDPCDRLLPLELGDAVTGTLVPRRSCALGGRLWDHYGLELDAMTAFQATAASPDFRPAMFTWRGPRGLPQNQITGQAAPAGSSTVLAEQLLPAGSYTTAPSSVAFDFEDPPAGSYSFTTEAVPEPQVGCIPVTYVMHGSIANGRVTDSDCGGPAGEIALAHWDGYTILLFAGQTVTVTLTSQVPFSFTRWAPPQPGSPSEFQEGQFDLSASGTATFTHTAGFTAFHVFFVVVDADDLDETKTYTMTFSVDAAPGALMAVAGAPAGRDLLAAWRPFLLDPFREGTVIPSH